MPLVPIASAFAVALIGGLAVGFRPGYPFGAILLGASIAAAMTGLVAPVLQFLPDRRYLPVAVALGVVMGLIVGPMLGAAQVLGFGNVRPAVDVVWPVAIVTGLVVSHASGMHLPTPRRRRPTGAGR